VVLFAQRFERGLVGSRMGAFPKDILERESWRVIKDDSKEEKSGREVGNCVKGLWMRRPLSPPAEELLPECLCVTMSKA